MLGYIKHSHALMLAMNAKRETVAKITGEAVYLGIMGERSHGATFAEWDMLPADYQAVYLGIAEQLCEVIKVKVGL